MTLTVDGLGSNYIVEDTSNPSLLESNDARVQLIVKDTDGNLLDASDITVTVDGIDNLYVHTDGSFWISNNESTPSTLSRVITVELNDPLLEIGEFNLGLVGSGNYEIRNLSAEYGVTDSFDYVPVDGDGNVGADVIDNTPSTVTIDTRFVDQAPTVFASDVSVSEEGLSDALADSQGVPDDNDNEFIKSGVIRITDQDSDSFTIALTGPASISSDDVDIVWNWDSVAQELTGTTTGGDEIAVISLGAQTDTGSLHSVAYTITLKGPVDHPDNTVEDVLDLEFGVNVIDSSGQVATSSFTVSVEDDSPEATNSAESVLLPSLNTNLLIALDVSGSMKSGSGVDDAQGNELSRLELAQQSLEQLINNYDDLGNVKVRIVTFSTVAQKYGQVWLDADQAITYLTGLVESDADGWTNYDGALAVMQDAFDDTGSLQNAQNVSYFLSDGVPTASDGDQAVLGNSSSDPGESNSDDTGKHGDHGLQAVEIATWESFLDGANINSIALGMGGNVSADNLDPIAFDGSDDASPDRDSVIVSDLNQLSSVIDALVIVPLKGNLIDQNGGFGADGGYVQSVTITVEINGAETPVTYTFDRENDSISNSVDANVVVGSILIVESALLANVEINMLDASYEYQISDSTVLGSQDTVTYKLIDNDGDTSIGKVDFDLEAPVGPSAPDAVDDFGTNNNGFQAFEMQSGSALSIAKSDILSNDSDPQNDTLTILDQFVAQNGTVSMQGDQVVFTPVDGFQGDTSFDYTITDGNGGYDTATVHLTVTPESIQGEAVNANTNVLIMLDTSGSMGGSNLTAAKAALESLLTKFKELGNVKVQLATFNEDVNGTTSGWISVDSAINLLDDISTGGGTNYDYALDIMESAFAQSGKLSDAKNVSYFLSDGIPTLSSDNDGDAVGGSNSGSSYDPDKGDGIDDDPIDSEVDAWTDFLSASGNEITSYAVAIGDNVDAQHLDPIAYDGANDIGMDAIIPSELDNLAQELVDSVANLGQNFVGNANANAMVAGLGEDFMTGNDGADSFIFNVDNINATEVETDTIIDFDKAEGDQLDLSDLLSGVSTDDLDSYLNFESLNGDTLVHVSKDGDFGNNSNTDHTILLKGVNLASGGLDDSQIITDLLDNNHLIVD